MLYEFFIPGKPIAQGRPKFANRGKFVTAYEPKTSKEHKKHCIENLQKQLPEGFNIIEKDHAVSVDLIFCFLDALRVKKNIPHTIKPDIDNLAKLILDVMNGIFFKDDSCVTQLLCKKIWVKQQDELGTIVRVYD